jgi:hypothetical protein
MPHPWPLSSLHYVESRRYFWLERGASERGSEAPSLKTSPLSDLLISVLTLSIKSERGIKGVRLRRGEARPSIKRNLILKGNKFDFRLYFTYNVTTI